MQPLEATGVAGRCGAALERPVLGVLLALAAVILWGSNAVIVRHLAVDGVSMTVVAFLRTAIGGLALGLWVALTAPASLQESGAQLRDRWVWLALFCYGGNMLVFHWALARTSASAVMILENTAPVVALFGGAWLFRERLTRRALLALGMSLGGVVLVATADPGIGAALTPGAFQGNMLGILAGITWGVYTLACRGHGRSSGGRQKGQSAMMVVLFGSAVLLAPTLLGAAGWPHTPAAWAWILTLGVLHTALATTLWRLSLAHIPAFAASLLFLLTIVLTMANAVLFLDEHLTPLMLLGAGAIVAALLALPMRSAAGRPGGTES
ncbi:MAG: DMT family transporter [Planctomycetes bacterium]|nr:DMT family transporter [Planctomycetota bacterium]